MLPEDIEMKATFFGDGAGGAATKVLRNEEHKVQVVVWRESRKDPFQELWTHDTFPDEDFLSYKQLREFVNAQKSS